MSPRQLVVVLAALLACGPGEKKNDDSARAAAPAQHSLMIMAQEYTFDAPDTVPAGFTRVSLMNHGAEQHHALLIRMDSGHVAGELLAHFQKRRVPPNWVAFYGGPSVSVQPLSENFVDLTPGNYVMICIVPSPDGTPHVAKGMVRQLTVVPGSVATTAPKADLTITLSDYAFTPSAPLTSGQHIIRVDNVAEQPHELFIIKLEPGKTIQEYATWASSREGPRPGAPVGGTMAQSRGITNYVIADLTPGEYGFVCFIADAKDGKPHLAHGMIQQFTIG